MAIGKEDAMRLAEKHASASDLDHPDYRMECQLQGHTPEGWLFSYRIRCLKDIPPQEQEKFAGAAGFLISPAGTVQDLSWPMYAEVEKRLGPV
ncbi:MAG TPA: hypothetical protein VLC73_04935 [Burkholderiales bacterium]|nr:hypothetical protein [Burkholderiales bacterium]